MFKKNDHMDEGSTLRVDRGGRLGVTTLLFTFMKIFCSIVKSCHIFPFVQNACLDVKVKN